jgi:hypothetical protein
MRDINFVKRNGTIKSNDESSTDITEVGKETKSESPKKGVVTDCWMLNIREEPDSNAKIIGTLNQSSEIIVYEQESTDRYYKICTASGIEGFCMQNYITIQQ